MNREGSRARSLPRRIGRYAMLGTAGLTVCAVVVAAVLGVGSWWWGRRDDAKARMSTSGPYEASLGSVRSHPLPGWFRDAKFGVMVHWGPYSVPGFAPVGRTFAETLREDYGHALTRSPYAEDYANQIKDPGTPAAAFHRERYGDADYADLALEFERGLDAWDPDAWARTFRESGASYVVLTAKYADGYSLWPTAVRNPHAPEFHSTRDLVGELARAVRAQGMRFGLYYSGGVDWTFHPAVVETLGDYAFGPYAEGYPEYAEAQVRELIERYEPDLLWNDIGWPTGQQRLNALFADYYNTVPDGVVNDRWETASFLREVISLGPVRWIFDQVMRRVLAEPGAAERVTTPPDVPHSDFRTPEYTGFDTVQEKFWQQDRGIGGSFGYNRQETDADYAPPEELLTSLVQAAANNGALLLNVGPTGTGEIVPEQRHRLDAIGAWLRVNGEAMDGTRPWEVSSARTADGTPVMFTRRGSRVYAILLGRPAGPVTLRDIQLDGTARMLGSGAPAQVRRVGTDTVLDAAFTGSFAPVVAVTTE
ncbi:alpha-L-fucosidase [Nocardia sp. CC201C]|uniref:alpha-L-fucosidase n=1 Tax=Nocardia sp. CC201C TaxID=3044575 RepID=UPI0024A919E2|nr:alpha-L-fucosidase [Nocardia sp. CC201C]